MSDAAPAKVKTPKKKAAAKPKKAAEHPKYIDMIVAAIKNTKDKKGVSRQSIVKYVKSNYKVGNEVKKINVRVNLALKNGVKSGVLKQQSGVGAQGRFKVGDKAVKKAKKVAKPKVKKPAAKKPKAAKKPAGEKKAKKPAVKKSPKKAKAAKPKVAKKSPKKTKTAKPKKPKSPKKKAATKKSAKK